MIKPKRLNFYVRTSGAFRFCLLEFISHLFFKHKVNTFWQAIVYFTCIASLLMEFDNI